MDECRQIENLIYTYAELIDNGDLIGVSKLFKNAEISAPAFSSNQVGSEEILKMVFHVPQPKQFFPPLNTVSIFCLEIHRT